jgi:hypothetical protein
MSAIVPLVAHKTLYLGNPHDAAYYDPLPFKFTISWADAPSDGNPTVC